MTWGSFLVRDLTSRRGPRGWDRLATRVALRSPDERWSTQQCGNARVSWAMAEEGVKTYRVGPETSRILPTGGPGHSLSLWPGRRECGGGDQQQEKGEGQGVPGRGRERGGRREQFRGFCAGGPACPPWAPHSPLRVWSEASRTAPSTLSGRILSFHPHSPRTPVSTSCRDAGQEVRPREQARGRGGGIPFGDPCATLPHDLCAGGLWDHIR